MRAFIVVREFFDDYEIMEVFDNEPAANENAATREANNPHSGRYIVESFPIHGASHLKPVKRRIGGEAV